VRGIESLAGCCGSRGRETPLPRGRRVRLVAALRALADPTRVEIFRRIAAHGAPLCVCELTEAFDFTQPTISYHLRILRRAGLVDVSRRGVWAHYAARPAGLAELRAFLDGIHRKEKP
jgi:ArsR family transcriptional regulator